MILRLVVVLLLSVVSAGESLVSFDEFVERSENGTYSYRWTTGMEFKLDQFDGFKRGAERDGKCFVSFMIDPAYYDMFTELLGCYDVFRAKSPCEVERAVNASTGHHLFFPKDPRWNETTALYAWLNHASFDSVKQHLEHECFEKQEVVESGSTFDIVWWSCAFAVVAYAACGEILRRVCTRSKMETLKTPLLGYPNEDISEKEFALLNSVPMVLLPFVYVRWIMLFVFHKNLTEFGWTLLFQWVIVVAFGVMLWEKRRRGDLSLMMAFASSLASFLAADNAPITGAYAINLVSALTCAASWTFSLYHFYKS